MITGAEGVRSLLGQLLLERGVIDHVALDAALDLQGREHMLLGEAFVALGSRQEDVWEALGRQWGYPLTDLSRQWVDPALANELKAREAIRHRILPMRRAGDKAIVAMADPRDVGARDYAEAKLRMPIVPIVATPASLRRRQEVIYRHQLAQVACAQLHATAPQSSAHITLSRGQKKTLVMAALGAVALIVLIKGA